MVERAEMLRRARAMRREPTDAERVMWRMLRARGFDGLKFRRQVPLGVYIADFACFDPRVIIECDGGQHADCRYDEARDAWFRAQGFRVMRFWNNHVLYEPEGVEIALLAAIGRR
jgi:very-short-patch-repair endonuclease